ncbi:MAG: DUF2007 domain-containing protein [Bacteroidales bacterium]|jgi:hypothetical protein|nr:DUF2007 domain-containing protein [Bacteroidales bacterium]HOI31615.1 DUF2007 domain-containing protein [Bacteroidales bacterium]
MEHSNELIEIFAGSHIQALTLKYELEEAEIPCMIRNDQEAGNLVGIGSIQSNVRILIEEDSMEKARPVLEAFLEKNAD